MEYNLLISSQAEEDTIVATDYYDRISPNLGTRFLLEVSETYTRIKTNPQFYSFISSHPADGFRAVKLNYFPFVVIYEIQGSDIYISAVMNTHRDH